MTRLLTACVLLTAMAGGVLAQQNKAANLKMAVYRVDDLLLPPKNYPFNARQIPTVGEQGQAAIDPYAGFYGMGGGMGGMGGGGGGFGGGGGGFFAVQSAQGQGNKNQGGTGLGASNTGAGGGGGGMGMMGGGGGSIRQNTGVRRFGIQELIGVITTIVAPESWDQVGGPASCVPLGGMIVVSQTPEAHKQISELLDQVRSQGGALKTVSVSAHWLHLDATEVEALLANGSKTLVNKDALKGHAGKGYRGQVSCFSGQTVHIVAGERKQVWVNAVPVIGDTVGYSVQSTVPNFGVLLQVTPLLMNKQDQAILDLQSSLTSDLGTKPAEGQIPIDRTAMASNQLATTVKIPLGVPVLVGGMSSSKGEDDERVKSTYLIVQLDKTEK